MRKQGSPSTKGNSSGYWTTPRIFAAKRMSVLRDCGWNRSALKTTTNDVADGGRSSGSELR
jgi:hypothetical protein